MIWNLDPGWLMMAVAVVAVLAFFFGSALDAIMREDGFGPTGNMLLFTFGFFMAVIIANTYGHQPERPQAGGGLGARRRLRDGQRAGGCSRPAPAGSDHNPTISLMSPGVRPASLSAARPVSRKLLESFRPSGPRISR